MLVNFCFIRRIILEVVAKKMCPFFFQNSMTSWKIFAGLRRQIDVVVENGLGNGDQKIIHFLTAAPANWFYKRE